ncbi:MAG: HEAT repeat domain-containing protein [Nitrospiraceae bacterium]|nr:MAG: HEAT repeat domain-containing protein [Nitrospiraceae bacterium]
MHTAKLQKLLRQLNDGNPEIRRSAAEELAIGDERVIYPLIKALRDEHPGVQDAAMRSLTELQSETTAYMVLPLLRENALLRNTALIILKELGKISVPLLYVLLDDKDDDIRKFAVDLIHDIEYCNYPEKLVELLTGDPNANVRAAAAKTLGKLQYKKALPQLITALKDDEWVSFAALESLTTFRDEKASHALMELLQHPSDAIRFAAIEALGKMQLSITEEHLIKHLSRSRDNEKRATVKSLVNIGTLPSSPDIADALMELLQEDDINDKLTAIKGLVSIRYEKAIRQIVDFAGSLEISDPESDETVYVIKKLLQNFECNSQILDILKDPSVKYRGKVIAIELAGDLRCSEAVPILIELLNSDHRDVRRTSVESLGKIRSDESREYLIAAISDHDSHVRKSAVSTIGKIGDMSAFEPLMSMLKNEQYKDVIDEVIRALMSINNRLFLQRINEFDRPIQEMVSRYAENFNSGVSC